MYFDLTLLENSVGNLLTISLISFFSFSSANIKVISKFSDLAKLNKNSPTQTYSASLAKTESRPLSSSTDTSYFLNNPSNVVNGICFKYVMNALESFFKALKSFSKPAKVLGIVCNAFYFSYS